MRQERGSEEVKMTKSERESARTMFGGRCAYCGCELGERFHADHIDPIFRGWEGDTRPKRAGKDEKENIFPSCQRCNLWKSTLSVEDFRNAIKHQTFQLNRDSSNYRMAKDFCLITENDTPVIFYFERHNKE